MRAPFVIANRDARRLFMHTHGLSRPTRGKFSRDDLLGLIHQLGFVQLDSINTVERAHHMILYSRANKYKREDLAHLLEQERTLFEHWTHDASLIPTAFYPYWRHRFDHAKKAANYPRWQNRLGPNGKKIIRTVRERIKSEGPLMSRDFEDKGQGAWWGWGPSKTALEYLWRTGELAITGRQGFQKIYDLRDRVIPEDARTHSKLSKAALIDWKCREALERLGFATPGDLARFWATVSPKDAAAWAAKQKDLIQVTVDTANKSKPRSMLAFADIEDRLAAAKAAPKAPRFLSPFDPLIRDRTRTENLFGFDYRIEIFVPEKKRQYGYYVLPILEGDRFTGRADIKVHRKEDRLEVKGLWLEKGVALTPKRQDGLSKALTGLAKFTGVTEVDWDPQKTN